MTTGSFRVWRSELGFTVLFAVAFFTEVFFFEGLFSIDFSALAAPREEAAPREKVFSFVAGTVLFFDFDERCVGFEACFVALFVAFVCLVAIGSPLETSLAPRSLFLHPEEFEFLIVIALLAGTLDLAQSGRGKTGQLHVL